MQQAERGHYPMTAEREIGWLIEEFEGGNPRWLKAYHHEQSANAFDMSPTTNANEALRFARKCDAEAFLHNLKALKPCWSHCFVTDHEWMALGRLVGDARDILAKCEACAVFDQIDAVGGKITAEFPEAGGEA